MQKTTHHCECIPVCILLERIYTGVINKDHWYIINGVQYVYDGDTFVRDSDNTKFPLTISSFDIRELGRLVFVIAREGEEVSYDEDEQ